MSFILSLLMNAHILARKSVSPNYIVSNLNSMKYKYEIASRYHENNIQGGMSFPLLEMTNPFRYCVAPVYNVFIFCINTRGMNKFQSYPKFLCAER